MLQKKLKFYKWIYLLLLFLPACSKGKLEKETLRISFISDPLTTDPRLASDFTSSTLVCMLYEGLTRCSPDGGVENALAKSVEISKDKLSYTFHLRDAKWTDGTPISALDFEQSWKKIIETGAPNSFLFYPIKGAEKCIRKEGSIEEVAIYALDPLTLKVELEHPTPYFYNLTAFPSFLPVATHAKEGTNVVSGPFTMKKEKGQIFLRKNPLFWNKKNIHIDAIDISIIPDEMTALQLFEQGMLDWVGGTLSPLPLDAIESLKTRLLFIPSAASTICTFNTKTFPFSNLSMRKAFSLAINREEIVSQVTHSGQIAARSILPTPFTSLSENLYDEKRALKLFEKALIELDIQPKDLQNLTLFFKDNQIEKRIAQMLQKKYKELFKIDLKLSCLDYKSHAQRVQQKDYQIALASWIAQFDDPVSILDRFKMQESRKNYPGWEDGHYQALLNQASISSKREELFTQAEKLLLEEMPLTPIYHWRSAALVGPRVKSITTTPSGGILFERFVLY